MFELPSSVIKTRGLLNLRAYKTTELLEYDDKYVMYPTKGEGEKILRYVVWVLKEPKVIGIAFVKEVGAQRGMLVGGLRFTPAAKKEASSSRVELVEGGYASFDLFEHELVPPHSIASEEEINLVLNHYKINKTQLPRISHNDSAVRVLGAVSGQVLRIERNSDTAGSTFYYRLVVRGG
jgi:DNA-directed RNA polymerase subunit H